MNRIPCARLAVLLAVLSGAASVADEPPPAVGGAASDTSRALDELLSQLGSESFIQRDWAARRLVQQGPDVVPRIVAAARESRQESVAAAVIGLLGDMSRNRDRTVAASALRGLSSLHDDPGRLAADTRSILESAYQDALRHNVAELTALGAEVGRDDEQRIIRISIHSDNFTDRHMPLLSAFATVTTLDLRSTAITGDGLPSLASLVNLERLILTDTRITGAGLRRLPPLTELDQLSLYRLPLSDDDRRWLQDHLPDCHVNP